MKKFNNLGTWSGSYFKLKCVFRTIACYGLNVDYDEGQIARNFRDTNAA